VERRHPVSVSRRCTREPICRCGSLPSLKRIRIASLPGIESGIRRALFNRTMRAVINSGADNHHGRGPLQESGYHCLLEEET
jgi:hypothetical protein